jgi:Septation protein etd1
MAAVVTVRTETDTSTRLQEQYDDSHEDARTDSSQQSTSCHTSATDSQHFEPVFDESLPHSDSDSDTRATMSDEDFDFQSDTVFDSYRTGVTSISSMTRGPHIETIFDGSSPQQGEESLHNLKSVMPEYCWGDDSTPQTFIQSQDQCREPSSTPVRRSTMTSAESLTTPVKSKSNSISGDTIVNLPSANSELDRGRLQRPSQSRGRSSPPKFPSPLALGKLEWNSVDSKREAEMWDYDASPTQTSSTRANQQHTVDFSGFEWAPLAQSSSSPAPTSRKSIDKSRDGMDPQSRRESINKAQNSPPQPSRFQWEDLLQPSRKAENEDKSEEWTFDDEDWEVDGKDYEMNDKFPNYIDSSDFVYEGTDRPLDLSDLTAGSHEKDPREALFDWSETTPDRKSRDDSSPRPKTAHAKQGVDVRGRRAPSNLHTRSQSVPVLPDLATQQELGGAVGRFSTLGLGSKGVSEDWNEDFDFEAFGESTAKDIKDGSMHDEGVVAMMIPREIAERQASVLGHLSYIKEFTILVEDLKRLRSQAVSKGIRNGEHAELWDEADGIIALATIDEDEDEQPTLALPSEAGFESEFFDDELARHPLVLRSRHNSILSANGGGIGTMDDWATSAFDSPRIGSATSPSIEKRNPAAVARTVVETMHQRRTTSDPILSTYGSDPKDKMPFDTTTLRDLVSHVGGLRRSLAELVREDDSLPSTPIYSPQSQRNDHEVSGSSPFLPQERRSDSQPETPRPLLSKSKSYGEAHWDSLKDTDENRNLASPQMKIGV